MLARWQRVLVIASLLAAAAWLAWCLHAGLGAWAAAAGVALLLLPQAPVLALEFALLAWLGRDPAAPRASAGQLLRAFGGEVRASWQVFGWRQPFLAGREPDPLADDAAGRTAVLLVHGYFCNRGLWLPWLRRLRALGVPCRALTIEPAFGRIDDWVPAIEAAVAALIRQTGRPPLLVAHSMGGLAVRAWLAAQPDAERADARVLQVVTIGTPHHGTWMARFAHTPNARQMQRQGRFVLAELAGRGMAGRVSGHEQVVEDQAGLGGEPSGHGGD